MEIRPRGVRAETPGCARARPESIGRLNERSLHAALRRWYSVPTDRFEVRVDGYVIDIVRGDILIEIQTGSFSGIRDKLRDLASHHQIRLVHPIARRKWIVRVARNGGDVIGRRKSSREGSPLDLFDELTSIPDLVGHGNLSVDVLMTEEEEVRRDDGRGSRWRGGASIVDRRLVSVIERIELHDPRDFLLLLPRELGARFTNRDLARIAGVSVYLARKATYCLRKMGAIAPAGKKGLAKVFERARGPVTRSA